MGISQEDEDRQRASNNQSQAQRGTQTLKRLRFPKAARLLNKRQYQGVVRAGRRFTGSFIHVDYRHAEAVSKLGITVSKRYGKAHLRNRFKRVVREAFRHAFFEFPRPLELNISPKHPMTGISTQEILQDLNFLISSLPCSTQNNKKP
jgi:ribonuclease P protein component